MSHNYQMAPFASYDYKHFLVSQLYSGHNILVAALQLLLPVR